jgi:hypothetical protein
MGSGTGSGISRLGLIFSSTGGARIGVDSESSVGSFSVVTEETSGEPILSIILESGLWVFNFEALLRFRPPRCLFDIFSCQNFNCPIRNEAFPGQFPNWEFSIS